MSPAELPVMLKLMNKRVKGQTGTEYMLIISVVVIAVVAAAYVYVPEFKTGVMTLGTKVMTIMDKGCISGCYRGG